jgi:hypothetical protein
VRVCGGKGEQEGSWARGRRLRRGKGRGERGGEVLVGCVFPSAGNVRV